MSKLRILMSTMRRKFEFRTGEPGSTEATRSRSNVKFLALVLICIFAISDSLDARFAIETTNELSNGKESKQFERLDEQSTGIDFVSRLLPDHPYAFLYHSGMTCSGIAAGDLSGDGLPDLILANGPGENAIYIQTGEDLRFENATDKFPQIYSRCRRMGVWRCFGRRRQRW